MTISLSDRLKSLPVSSVRKLMPYAAIAEKSGVTIYRLNMGEPDISSPQVMLDALKSFHINPVRYAPSGGTKEYLAALLTYYHRLGHTFIRDDQIIGTTAGSEGINMALFGACNPGDGVLVFEPFYSAYATATKLFGIELYTVETKLHDGFHLPTQEIIERSIKPNTKAILLANPNNPTGTVFSRQELELLVRIAQKHNLFLISDEVYREYVFVDEPHVSILNYMESLPDQLIMIDSLSKRYSICGARLGAIVSLNRDFMAGALKYAMSRLSGGLIDQHIGAQLVHVPTSYTQAIRDEFKKRRDVAFRLLSEILGVDVALPEGAFYIFARLPVADAETFCIWLLETYRKDGETVFLAPGSGFYADPAKGKQFVRIAYVLEEKKLVRSLELLKDALQQYKLIKN